MRLNSYHLAGLTGQLQSVTASIPTRQHRLGVLSLYAFYALRQQLDEQEHELTV